MKKKGIYCVRRFEMENKIGLVGDASSSMGAICKLSKYKPAGTVFGMNANSEHEYAAIQVIN